jgi:predicted nucleic acid-binding protein
MTTSFLDTNIFIRYLTNDDPDKAEKVDKLLIKAGRGKVQLITTELVLAEVVWVLESFYGLKNFEIAPMIKAILATPGLETINGQLVENAVEFYVERNIDFIDGYIAAVMGKRRITEIFSYDKKHLQRLKSITRKEP